MRSKLSPVLKALTLIASLVLLASCGGGENVKARLDQQNMTPDQAYLYALEMLQAKDYEQALPLLQRANEKVGRSAEMIANLGVAQAELGQHDKALENLTRALSMAPSNGDITNQIAITYRMQGQFDKAKKLYERQIAVNPNNARAHYNLGVLCELYMNKPSCALEHYKQFQALSEVPDDTVKIWVQVLEAQAGQAGG